MLYEDRKRVFFLIQNPCSLGLSSFDGNFPPPTTPINVEGDWVMPINVGGASRQTHRSAPTNVGGVSIFCKGAGRIGILFVLILLSIYLFGEEIDDNIEFYPFSPSIYENWSIFGEPFNYEEENEENEINELLNPYSFELPKNPVKAGLLSAFIPGAGQIYNEKYIKASGVILVQSYLVGMSFYCHDKMLEYRRKRNETDEINAKAFYQNMYEDYFERRQSYIYWVGASIFISSMEAFVDAHLINFNSKRNEVRLKFQDQSLQISITF
ncbi:MAG: DUF5683 domain-containing protein [Candidatus Cloacimonetes bacterium]|nr:DUF5683 domain-containing protein [Candidatus Cloacimonadota bacterium]